MKNSTETFPIDIALNKDLPGWPADKLSNQIYATKEAHIANPIDENQLVISFTNSSASPLVPSGTTWDPTLPPQFHIYFDQGGVPSLGELNNARLYFKDPALSSKWRIYQPQYLQTTTSPTLFWILEPLAATNMAVFDANESFEVVLEYLYTFDVADSHINITYSNMPSYSNATDTIAIESVNAPHPEVAYFLLNRTETTITIDYADYYWIYWKTYNCDYCQFKVTEGGTSKAFGGQYNPFGQLRINPAERYLKTVYTLQAFDTGVAQDFEQTVTVNINPPTLSNVTVSETTITQGASVIFTWEASNCSKISISDGTNTTDYPPDTTTATFTPNAASTTYTITVYGALQEDGTPATVSQQSTIQWGVAKVTAFTHDLDITQLNADTGSVQTAATFTWATEYATKCTLCEIVDGKPQPLTSALQQSTPYASAPDPGFVTRTYQLVLEGYSPESSEQIVLAPPFVDVDQVFWSSGNTIYVWVPAKGASALNSASANMIDYLTLALSDVGNANNMDPNYLYWTATKDSDPQAIIQYDFSSQQSKEIFIPASVLSFDYVPDNIAFLSTSLFMIQNLKSFDYTYASGDSPYPKVLRYINEAPTTSTTFLYFDFQNIYYWNTANELDEPQIIATAATNSYIRAMSAKLNTTVPASTYLTWIEESTDQMGNFQLYSASFQDSSSPPATLKPTLITDQFEQGLYTSMGMNFGVNQADGSVDDSAVYFMAQSSDKSQSALWANMGGSNVKVCDLPNSMQATGGGLVVLLASTST